MNVNDSWDEVSLTSADNDSWVAVASVDDNDSWVSDYSCDDELVEESAGSGVATAVASSTPEVREQEGEVRNVWTRVLGRPLQYDRAAPAEQEGHHEYGQEGLPEEAPDALSLIPGKGGIGFYAVSRSPGGNWIAKLPKKHLMGYTPIQCRGNAARAKCKGMPLGSFRTETQAAEAVAQAMRMIKAVGGDAFELALVNGRVPWANRLNEPYVREEAGKAANASSGPGLIMEPSFCERETGKQKFRSVRDKAERANRAMARKERQRENEFRQCVSTMFEGIEAASARLGSVHSRGKLSRAIQAEADAVVSMLPGKASNRDDRDFIADCLNVMQSAARSRKASKEWGKSGVGIQFRNMFVSDSHDPASNTCAEAAVSNVMPQFYYHHFSPFLKRVHEEAAR